MTGTTIMARALGRTKWKTLLAWPTGLTLLVLAVGQGIVDLYSQPAQRVQYQGTMAASPASWAFNGRAYDADSLGGILAFEVGFMGQLLLPVFGVLLAVSLTRAQEDSGRLELLTSGVLGHRAPVTAGALWTLGCIGAFATASWAGLSALGFPLDGSGRYATSLALFALMWAGIGLLIGQLSQNAQAARAVGLCLALAGFCLRALVDGRSWDLEWLSFSGWVVAVQPWSGWHWPYALGLAGVAIATIVAGVVVAGRRDLYAGVLTPRPGPTRGPAWLGTSAGAAWRLTRASFVVWLVGGVAFGTAFGSMAQEMGGLIEDNPQLAQALGTAEPELIMTMLAMLVVALASACVGVSGFTRLTAEEESGRLGLLLSGVRTRRRVWCLWSAVVVAEAMGTLGVGSAGVGVSQWLVQGDTAALWSAVDAGVGYAVPVLAVTAVTATLHAVFRRLVPAAWGLVAWAAVVGTLADTLGLATWARNLSPLELVGRLPVDSVDNVNAALLGVAVVVLGSVALTWFVRRDLAA